MLNCINSIPKRLIFDGNSMFNLMGAATTPYIFFGYSVSTRVRSSMITYSPKTPIFDYSIQGKTSAQLLADFPTKVQPYVCKTDVLIYWELINSLRTGSTPAQALADLKAYCALAKQYVAKVYILTCIPAITAGVTDADRLTLNSLILADTSFCDGVIDPCTLPQFDSVTDTSDTIYYQIDTLHLTIAGYNLIGDTIFNNSAIQSNFP